MAKRDVDSVDPAYSDTVDPALVWWLIKLSREDRAMYRRVRAIAWDLAVENSSRSAIPNNLS